MPVQITTPH